MRFLTFILFVCALALCKSDDEYYGVAKYDDFAIIDSIVQEPECIRHGGMCVIASDCTGELTTQRGLCPTQTRKGVECCYGHSRKETRCGKVGGVCVPLTSFCNEKIVFSAATDCYQQKCCILV